MQPIVPSYYAYEGYRVSEAEETHLEEPLILDEAPLLDFSKANEYWLTIYLTPTHEAPRTYTEHYNQSEFGKLLPE